MFSFRCGNPDPSLLLATIKMKFINFCKRSSRCTIAAINSFRQMQTSRINEPPIELAKRSRATTKSNQTVPKLLLENKKEVRKMKIVKCSEHVSFVCVHILLLLTSAPAACWKWIKMLWVKSLFFDDFVFTLYMDGFWICIVRWSVLGLGVYIIHTTHWRMNMRKSE